MSFFKINQRKKIFVPILIHFLYVSKDFKVYSITSIKLTSIIPENQLGRVAISKYPGHGNGAPSARSGGKARHETGGYKLAKPHHTRKS